MAGIFKSLSENKDFLKINTVQSQTEASIGFSLDIKPKATLRYVLKQKIKNMCTWLDLDSENVKIPTKDTTSNHIVTQKQFIPAFDIYQKIFESRTGSDRVTTTVYEIRISPQDTPILKNILCEVSEPDNDLALKFIPYYIEGIIHKDIYQNLIHKQNAFSNDNFIIPVFDIEERDVGKFRYLLKNQHIFRHRTNK